MFLLCFVAVFFFLVFFVLFLVPTVHFNICDMIHVSYIEENSEQGGGLENTQQKAAIEGEGRGMGSGGGKEGKQIEGGMAAGQILVSCPITPYTSSPTLSFSPSSGHAQRYLMNN